MPRPPAVPRMAVVTAALAAVCVGCQPPKPPPPAPPPPTVTVSTPVVRTVPDLGEYTGFTEAIQRVEVRPRVRGRLDKVHVPEGTEIAAGRLLYEIDPREYVTARDEAKASLDRALKDLARAEAEDRLAKASLQLRRKAGMGLSREELDQAIAAERTAAAAVGQAQAAVEQAQARLDKAELDLSFTKIYSPIAGRVSRTFVTEGNLVGYSDQTLLTVMVDQDPIYVYFDVPERDVIAYEARVKPARTLMPLVGGLCWRPLWSDAMIPAEVGVETEQGYPHKGVLNFREPRFESETGTIRLRAVLDNPDRTLSSGMYARLRFPLTPARPRLMVAATAVLSDQRGRYVWVVNPGGGTDPNDPAKRFDVAEPRTVVLGPQVGDLVAVESGVAAGDRVVVVGAQKVRPRAPIVPDLRPMPGTGQPEVLAAR